MMEQATKKKIKLAFGGLLVVIVILSWLINPVFGIFSIVVVAPILFVSSKRFSMFGKSIVAGAYIFVIGLFLKASLATYPIVWEHEFEPDKDIIIREIVLTSNTGEKIQIPLKHFTEIRKRAGLARSINWTRDWIEFRGTPWVEHFELFVDATESRDYRFAFRENEAIKGEIIAFLHLESPEGYKTKEHPDQLSGVFYVNELFEFVKMFDKPISTKENSSSHQ